MLGAMSGAGAWSTAEGAASWQASAASRQRTMAETTELLLSLAGVAPGHRVLEIGAGTGDVALMAAHRVGARGRVLATDASGAMLRIASRLAEEAGVANLTTRVMRAEELDSSAGSFDAAISRNCLMFVTDLPGTLRRVRSVLRQGGRFAASVWGPAEHNPYHGAPIAAVRRRGAIPHPVPEVVQAFSLSDGETVAAAMREAGFSGVEVQRANAARHFASLEDGLRVAREFPTFVVLVAMLSPEERERTWQEIGREWARFATPDGLSLPGEQLVIAGENPG
jgi:cyclopropane fatty-acyl-phospholipid synthase-like methyltransferase